LEVRDFIVTPIVIVMVYIVAYYVRPYCTDAINRGYFIPALTAKMMGALAVGFIYQFYYTSGDTFTYHTHGSRLLWEAFIESPMEGIRIYFAHGTYGPGLWEIADQIWFWRDPHSFLVIQIAAFFDLFTFSTYSATAILFSILSFIGGWLLYLVFYKAHPYAHRVLAICCLFIPSVIFWGSGLLKDTITLAFASISTFCIYKLFFEKRVSVGYILLFILSLFVVYSIKKYILISLIAALIVWISSSFYFKVRWAMLRIILVPIVTIFCLVLSYVSITTITEGDKRYSIENIALTSKITAYDIRYGWGARSGDGSGYSLGELDGTWQSMIKLAPGAINVSLFRPYLWEVSNPLMVLSALEGLATFFITLLVLFRVRTHIFNYVKAEVIFCLVFALIFAFGVGVSTFNFGTLSRYKIPLLPFYWSALAIIYSSWARDRKAAMQTNVEA
jgi:hypothetical protein